MNIADDPVVAALNEVVRRDSAITRKTRRPARNACSEERINPATKNTRPHANPMSGM
jgi:hypothetical protein